MNNEQAIVNRFLGLAVHDIINNKPTLAFLHPSDKSLVIRSIFQENNITISDIVQQVPIVEVITKLIIRQQIDFIPRERYSNTLSTEIGKLTFTTFFAMPNEKKSNFNIYRVITGPFVHNNRVVQLAQMPIYIGINSKEKSSISWTEDDLSACIFQVMTVCRETPTEKRFQYGNKCLEQVLTGKTLHNCRIEQVKVNLPYIRQLQNGRGLISTNRTTLNCIRTTTQNNAASKTAVWSKNVQVVIPPNAIVTVPNGTTIHCPEFNLPGPITPDVRPIINVIKNLSIFEEHSAIIDMHQELISNITWNKLPYINGDVHDLIQEMVAQATETSSSHNAISWHNQHLSKFTIVFLSLIAVLIVISVLLIGYIKCSTGNKTTIVLPSMSA